MPSHECQFCHDSFSSRGNLKRHQTTAAYCLSIQGKTQTAYACSKCSTTFSRQDNLDRHEKECGTSVVNVNNGTIINLDQSTTINNTININQTITPIAKRFTFSDLTDAYIMEKLTPVITKEVCKAGMGAITQLIVEVLLQRDGKYCYYCTNSRDKKFKMLVDHEGKVIEEPDPNAQALRSILIIPLEEIVSVVAEKNTIESVQKTYGEVSDLKKDGKGFYGSLASTLPCDEGGLSETVKAQIEAASNPDRIRRLEETRKRININMRRKRIEDMM